VYSLVVKIYQFALISLVNSLSIALSWSSMSLTSANLKYQKKN